MPLLFRRAAVRALSRSPLSALPAGRGPGLPAAAAAAGRAGGVRGGGEGDRGGAERAALDGPLSAQTRLRLRGPCWCGAGRGRGSVRALGAAGPRVGSGLPGGLVTGGNGAVARPRPAVGFPLTDRCLPRVKLSSVRSSNCTRNCALRVPSSRWSAPLPRWLSAARSAASRPERKAWGKVCGGSNRSVRCCGRAAGNADLWVGQRLPCSAAPFRAFCALFVCFFMSVCPVFHFCLLEASEREALTSARSCIE